MAAQVRIRLCSVLTVETADRTLTGRDLGSRKARTLLALLASERGRMVPLDRVVDALWASAPPADPAANVATLVSRSRRLLGEGVLAATGRAYGIASDACTVDLDEAGALTDEAAGRLAAGEPALAAAAARRALDLLGSPPALPDEPDADWVLRVRRQADDLRRRTRHLLAEGVTASEPAEAAGVAADAVAADPYDERAVRNLMRALVGEGSAAAALSAYDELAARLRDELGIDPAADTSRLHLAILREEPLPGETEASRRPCGRRPRPRVRPRRSRDRARHAGPPVGGRRRRRRAPRPRRGRRRDRQDAAARRDRRPRRVRWRARAPGALPSRRALPVPAALRRCPAAGAARARRGRPRGRPA